jgi:alkylation response protein AidB-like acyl-CoA dehydrogenase
MDFTLSEEQQGFRKLFRTFAQKEVAPQAVETDGREQVSRDVLNKAAEQGFLAAAIPEEHGGAALDAVSYALLLEELGQACAATAVVVALHSSLVARPLVLAGTPEQQARWLPALAGGEVLGGFALSEPDAGSDAAGLQATATLDGDTYVLNGVKSWVSNAGLAGLFVVAAATGRGRGGRQVPEGGAGISAFLVPRDAPGLTIGAAEPLLGLRGIDAHTLYLDDCRVPASHRLGAEGGAWPALTAALDHMRLGLAAIGLGIAENAFELGRQFAVERKQFGVSIATKQAIGNYFADTRLEIESLRHLVLYAAWKVDQGQDFALDAALAKLQAAQTARNAANRMLQVHGGYGFSEEYAISRVYRDARALAIMGGTDQIQRIRIAQDVFAGTGVEVVP